MQVGPVEPATKTQATPNADQAVVSEGDLSTQSESAGAITPPAGTFMDRIQDNPMLPSLLLFGGIMLMVIILFRSLRKSTRTRQIRQHNAGTPAQRIADIHERAQSSMDPGTKLMVDAESVARRLSAQLDNKGARLELLLEEADRKLEQLNRTLAALDRVPNTAQPSSTKPMQPSDVRVPHTIDPSVLDRARIDQDLADRSPSQPAASSTTGNAQDQINDRILRLADDGLGTVEIARSLNQPIGQVELVLNLRKTS